MAYRSLDQLNRSQRLVSSHKVFGSGIQTGSAYIQVEETFDKDKVLVAIASWEDQRLVIKQIELDYHGWQALMALQHHIEVEAPPEPAKEAK